MNGFMSGQVTYCMERYAEFIRLDRCYAVPNLVAIENDQHARFDLKLKLHDFMTLVASVEMAEQPRTGVVLKAYQDGPAGVLVVRGVVVPTDMVVCFGVGIEGATVRVRIRTLADLGIHYFP